MDAPPATASFELPSRFRRSHGTFRLEMLKRSRSPLRCVAAVRLHGFRKIATLFHSGTNFRVQTNPTRNRFAERRTNTPVGLSTRPTRWTVLNDLVKFPYGDQQLCSLDH
jgi:hypothetical protein